MNGYELILGELLLQGLKNLQLYQQTINNARMLGREVNDADIDALGALGEQIRAAARAEADRQRAEEPTP